MHTKLYKIIKFGVNRPNIKQDTELQKKCMTIQLLHPDDQHFFVNFDVQYLNDCISVKINPINTKLGGFVNVGAQ